MIWSWIAKGFQIFNLNLFFKYTLPGLQTHILI